MRQICSTGYPKTMTEPSTSFDSPWKDIVETYLPEFFGLFVTLYAKLTDKMPRQHTSNQKNYESFSSHSLSVLLV